MQVRDSAFPAAVVGPMELVSVTAQEVHHLVHLYLHPNLDLATAMAMAAMETDGQAQVSAWAPEVAPKAHLAHPQPICKDLSSKPSSSWEH